MKIPSPIRDLRPLVATLLLATAWAVVPHEAEAQSLRADRAPIYLSLIHISEPTRQYS